MNKTTFLLRLSFFLFLSLLISCSVAMNSSTREYAAEQQALSRPKISVQLWSVKDVVKKDFKSTLQNLAEMGFQGVEFAGEFGPFAANPKGLKAFLDELNLKASAAHLPFDALAEDSFETTVQFYQDLGVNTLIIPWDERAWHPEGVKAVVQELNHLSKQLAPKGMVIGFHNHDQEFNVFQGSTYWDYIARHTQNDVVLQLDVGWIRYTGNDPVEYVKRYPGRTLTTHYKIRTTEDGDLSPIIGLNPQLEQQWKSLLKANASVGGTQWVVVEQEEYPEGMTPMAAVKASKAGVDALFKQVF